MERSLKGLRWCAGCPCCCLLLPHFLRLDADVVYLLLAVVNLVNKLEAPVRRRW